MRRRVWFFPYPSVGFKAVAYNYKWWRGWVILFRGINGCGITWARDSELMARLRNDE